MADQSSLERRPLVFDLDGTLIDSRRDIAEACNYALQSSGRARLSVEEISGYVGNGAAYLLQNAAGGTLAPEEFDTLIRYFQDYYVSHPTEYSTLLPGAEAALRLSGRRKAVCTNKPRPMTEPVLENLRIMTHLAAVVAAGDVPERKPQPEPLLLMAQLLGVAPKELVMIGDGPQDVGAGKAVGAHTIGVRGGFLPEERMLEAEPDAVLDSLEDLPAYLEQHDL